MKIIRLLKQLKLISCKPLSEPKKHKFWLWTVVNSKAPGIVKFVVGDRTGHTFALLWQMIHGWACFLYITDGYKVYPCLIEKARSFNQQDCHDFS
jgi:IS1 family transposase